MYVTYDSTVDALSISFQERRSGDVARTERLDDRRLVDFDADGSALGVEILGAREFGIDLTGLPRAGEIQTTLHDFPRLPAAQPAR